MTADTTLTASSNIRRLGLAPRGLAAVAGIVAAGAALAVGELVAAFVSGAPSPVAAVGSVVIDLAPPGAKDVMVSLFGTNDKAALLVMVALVVLAVGAGLGILARTRPTAAMAGVVVLVGVGFLAMLQQEDAQLPMALLSAAIQAIVGIQVLSMLLAAAQAVDLAGDANDPVAAVASSRRGFLLRAGGLGALAVVGLGLGRSSVEGRATQVATVAAEIPQPVDPAPSPAPDSSFDVPGLTPIVMPERRTSTGSTRRSLTPSVDIDGWTLRIHGMVDREIDAHLRRSSSSCRCIEQYVTIACVSNEVGGKLVGNAKWTGVRLRDVLDMAGVQAGRDPARRRARSTAGRPACRPPG